MRPRTAVILTLLVLIGLFALLNWQSFSEPANLDFLVARIEAPLGVLMLIIICVLVVVFFLFLAKAELTMLWESRRVLRELEEARRLAAEVESSRVESLRASVNDEFAKINKKLEVILNKFDSNSGMMRPLP